MKNLFTVVALIALLFLTYFFVEGTGEVMGGVVFAVGLGFIIWVRSGGLKDDDEKEERSNSSNR